MRELKFRAWDNRHKMMCPVVRGIFPQGFAELKGRGMSVDAGYYRTPPSGDLKLSVGVVGEDFELLQYTGLKDKNGVEIYEGDVVEYVEKAIKPLSKAQLKKDPPGTIYSAALIEGRPEERHRRVVEYVKGSWNFDMSGDDWPYKEKAWVVIGNIYENPELLKGGEVI